MTAKEKQRIEQQKVERFLSGAACRRIYLDQEMDGRVDRIRCEEEEERCDVCQESDAIMNTLESQRRAYVRGEQEQDPFIDSGIFMPTSSMPCPSSPPRVPDEQINPDERVEFQAQQRQRQQQRLRCQGEVQQAGHAVWDLENRLDQWVGKCPLCYVRKCTGSAVNFQHTLEECVDPEQELVAQEVGVLQSIQFQRYASCYDCGVAQQICTQWEEIREGNGKFVQIKGGVCQYDRIVRPVVAAIMVAGPLEVVDQAVWSYMRAEGIWGANEKLEASEEAEVKRWMLKWFGQKVIWGTIEASVLLQVFYRSTARLEDWKRRHYIQRP
jgi:hypothetical protein